MGKRILASKEEEGVLGTPCRIARGVASFGGDMITAAEDIAMAAKLP